MKAAWFERYGDASDVLSVGERDTPRAAAGEVLVRVYASAVNPSDVKKRAGAQPALDDGWVIPHSDGAGVIEAVGAGVPEARIGERVWIYQAQFRRRFGTAAQYVALPAERSVRLPEGTGFEMGACLGIPAMTAHRCVFADGAVAGQTLLISGAAGRVGYYAVQLAKWGGARVIGTAGSDVRADAAREAGADVVLDYRRGDLAEAILDANDGKRVERVIEVEFGANLATACDVLAANGIIASYASMRQPEPALPFYRLMFNNATLRLVLVYDMPEPAKVQAAEDIVALLETRSLKHRVARIFTLDDIAMAHQAVEEGGLPGCAVVQID